MELLNSINASLKRVQDCGWDKWGATGQERMCGTNGLRVDEIIVAPYTIVQCPAFEPDVVFLHIGTNDCTQLNSGAWVGGSIAISITNLGTLLDHIRSANSLTRVFIAKIVPNTLAGANDQILLWNAAMATAVAARSDTALITVVDMYTTFTNNASWATDYMADATHPNLAGNTVMATTFYTAFDAIF